MYIVSTYMYIYTFIRGTCYIYTSYIYFYMPQSLNVFLCHWCSQMPLPPQSWIFASPHHRRAAAPSANTTGGRAGAGIAAEAACANTSVS